MDIDPKLILITLALVALCVPWLYDGSLFTRQRVLERKPLDKDEVRRRARQRL